MPPAHSPFVRRANTDGTTDSICTRCFATVATSLWEIDLDRAEQSHACEPGLLEHWKNFARGDSDGRSNQKPAPLHPRRKN